MTKEVKGKSGSGSKDKGKDSKKESKLSAYEQELLNTAKKIKEFSLASEANIVLLIYKNPELLYNHDLKLEDFNNNVWKVYFAIAEHIILKEKKTVLDSITVGLFLSKHPKLQEKYTEYGEYETILNGMEYIQESNFDGYLRELNKWNVVLKLLKMKFPVTDRISEFADMDSDSIYKEYEAVLNHIFINVDGENKSYNIADGIEDLIEELDEGLAVGLPYHDLPIITKETGGMLEGNITLIGALSNVGKSSFARNAILPSIIQHNERIVILLNEDGIKKWQRETLVWVANNILKKDLQKFVVRDGKYSKEIKDILLESAMWLKKQQEEKIITIIPMKSWSTTKAIKIMKKFSNLGVKHYMIDTFKNDAGKVSDNVWMSMMQNMVDLYDIIKPDVKNLHLTATFQLEKGKTARQRYYSQDNIGIAKNMIDPCSTTIMLRNLFEDEYDGGKNALKCFKLVGAKNNTKIPVKLNPDDKLQLAFIVKNREGSANQYCVVLKHDLSKNILKEIGITVVPVDF